MPQEFFRKLISACNIIDPYAAELYQGMINRLDKLRRIGMNEASFRDFLFSHEAEMVLTQFASEQKKFAAEMFKSDFDDDSATKLPENFKELREQAKDHKVTRPLSKEEEAELAMVIQPLNQFLMPFFKVSLPTDSSGIPIDTLVPKFGSS